MHPLITNIVYVYMYMTYNNIYLFSIYHQEESNYLLPLLSFIFVGDKIYSNHLQSFTHITMHLQLGKHFEKVE